MGIMKRREEALNCGSGEVNWRKKDKWIRKLLLQETPP